MRRMVVPLMVVGLAQWMALAWWRFIDGMTVEISLGRMFRELLGVTPRVAWDPAEQALQGLLDMTPGTLAVLIGAYLLARAHVGRLLEAHREHLRVEQLRQEMKNRLSVVPPLPAGEALQAEAADVDVRRLA